MPASRFCCQTSVGAPVAVCKDPQQPEDIPRGLEIAEKFGLDILLPQSGA